MLKNLGSADRIIRILTAVLLVALILAGTLTGIPALISGILAAVFLLTALFGFCPVYYILRLNSNRKVLQNK